MKRLNYFPFALAALMLGACSSDKDIVDSGSGNGVDAEGNGYLSVSINLPTQKASISRANDNTDDGTKDEYAVKNATLVLFGGQNEATAKIASAYNLGLAINDDADNDHITLQGKAVKKITVPSDENATHKYALVILNDNGVVTINGTTLKVGTKEMTNLTLADLTKETAASVSSFKGNGYFMTNAPLCNKPGTKDRETTGTTSILANVDNYIFNTESAALNSPGADIIVERAVAKVQLDATKAQNKELTVGSDKLKYSVSTDWALANQQTTSYLVRNWNQVPTTTMAGETDKMGDSYWLGLTSLASVETKTVSDSNDPRDENPYRFVGFEDMKTKESDTKDNDNLNEDCYRTYFGVDPVYDTDNTFAHPTDADFNTDEVKYCFENTFDVDHQTVRNTTCAIVKARFTLPDTWQDKTKFFIIGENKNAIYQESDIKTTAASRATDLYTSTLLSIFKDQVKGSSENYPSGKWECKVAETNPVTMGKRTEAGQRKVSQVDFTLTFTPATGETTSAVTKTYYVTEDETYTYENEVKKQLSTTTTLSNLNSQFVAYEYVNADAYYTVLIKHFGDDLTPWSAGSKTEAYPTPTVAGATRDGQYLGRYGVLRNNWYDIEVNGVLKIGSPVIPNVEKDETTDDKVESYVACKVNVLSWAKRTQGVTLE